jgi:hypothetical protein
MAPRLPFVRYVHSCTLAKNVPGGADPKIDEALKAYEEYVVGLNKVIMQATQYYSRKEYEKDAFAKGKELHKQLTEAFGKLDDQLAKFGTAVQDWRKGTAKLTDEIGPSGETALAAIDEARLLTFAAMVKEPDAAAIKASIDKISELADKLEKDGEGGAQAAFPRAVGPTLRSFIDAATDAHGAIEGKTLNAVKLYVLTATFTALSEAGNRGVTRHLYSARGGKGPGMGPQLPRRPAPGRPRPEAPPAPEDVKPAE